jgi:hypothetical protein
MTEQAVESAAVIEVVPAAAVLDALNEAKGITEIDGVSYVPGLEASFQVHIHPNYLVKIAKQGRLPYYRDGRKPGRIWFAQADLDTFRAEAETKEAEKGTRVPGQKGGKSKKHYNQFPISIRAWRFVAAQLREPNISEALTPETLKEVKEWVQAQLDEAIAEYTLKTSKAAAPVSEPATAATVDPNFQAALDK